MSKLRTLKQLLQFVLASKKYWLLPLFIVLGLLGFIIIFAEGSALAPFIYTIF